ncbi:FKBP-type peptidyl-prolyl cis-trans isomerase [Acinetobacter shaoyimingii]|uniref:Peptidyl-prolyl cis-trans isomerase n=1 Tax=Acinetobacter shaoyimingii TaxID=2715164 RepID=A0A6G8RRD9_9GAMM|nr:FKBP-type peptidyl-prolyl cis-trans isomerase [Acinetobacter shaoyimingii]NHB56948.1 FKBP-type peptidyl-prolyl cis-trans isomerase [Acinetobacter shaoyimingii]QIO04539.1 FKBP-type peptidyl-prolyl cis-trans isomerase [Acinetobacter shaoyimingii]
MKKILIATTIAALTSTSFAATVSNKSPQKDQLGYSYGYVMGRTNAETLKEINLDAFINGLKQGYTGQKSDLSDEDMAKALSQYKKQNDAKQLEAFKKVAAENLEAGRVFLEKNAKQAGIVTRPSGLQYQVLKAGNGKTPSAKSKVKVDYEGRLLDGTVFDSSIARNQPVEFQVSQVIPGWTEGLQLMKEGSKYRLFIPAKLAYGEMGSGDSIAPNSTLIFDVELLKVQ